MQGYPWETSVELMQVIRDMRSIDVHQDDSDALHVWIPKGLCGAPMH